MRNVGKPLLVVALFGAFGLLVWKVVLPALTGEDRPAGPPPVETTVTGLSAKERMDLASASDLDAPSVFRETLNRHLGTPVEAELNRMLAERAIQAVERLENEVDDLLTDREYRRARERIGIYRRLWSGSEQGKRIDALDPLLDERQLAQIDVRVQESQQLMQAGRYDAAREALVTGIDFEPAYRAKLDEETARMERLIRVHAHNRSKPTRPGQPTTPPTPLVEGEPGLPPPLPGLPHPDVKRLQEARGLTARARKLFRERRYEPAERALSDLIGYYPDLPFVKRNQEAIAAVSALSRHGTEGLGGLLNATKVFRKGKRIRLLYTFAGEAEPLDWEELPTIPHKEPGEFLVGRQGVRGSGVSTYLHRAYFKNDVVIRCKSVIREPRTHGLAFCQYETETRQILFLVTNHWFVEGENYVLERPGHSLLMIGKGTNNDVPVDSPEIGFIFEGPTRDTPAPPAGAELDLSFGLEGSRMTAKVKYKTEDATLRGEAVGDDGRGIVKVRPSLFVVQNSVLFKQVEIEGLLHPEWEQARVTELLHIAESLE